MRTVPLPDGMQVPCLGLGTWRLGESQGERAADVAAVRQALDLGYRLIDTAEMYGDGGAERVVGEALRAAIHAGTLRREDAFIVSKVLPTNASRTGTVAACERSLRRHDGRLPPRRLLGVDGRQLLALPRRPRRRLGLARRDRPALAGRQN